MFNTQTFLVIIHSIGAVLGVGSVTFAEIFYLKFKRFLGGQLHPTSNSFFSIIFVVERVGLVFLVLSGLGLLFLDGEALRTDPRLWAKLTIMVVLFFDVFGWRSRRVPGLLWGSVSIASWYTTLVLGVWRELNVSYPAIMAWYIAAIIAVMIILNLINTALGIKERVR